MLARVPGNERPHREALAERPGRGPLDQPAEWPDPRRARWPSADGQPPGRLGVPLVAAEPRIRAAVLGLFGALGLAEAAARITIPVHFVMQWDDERVPRQESLALFGAFASAEKTLHANPGKHGDVPAFETENSLRFFTRHLG